MCTAIYLAYERWLRSVIVYMQCCASLDLNNLGQLYKEKGMLAEAICTLEECLTVQHSILSPLHPEIGIS